MTTAPDTLRDDIIKSAIESIILDNNFKVILIDSSGNVISDIPLSSLLNNITGAWRLGISDLDVNVPVSVPSGIEVDFNDVNISSKYYNYGITRCHGNLLLKAGSKLKLGENSVFKFAR